MDEREGIARLKECAGVLLDDYFSEKNQLVGTSRLWDDALTKYEKVLEDGDDPLDALEQLLSTLAGRSVADD